MDHHQLYSLSFAVRTSYGLKDEDKKQLLNLIGLSSRTLALETAVRNSNGQLSPIGQLDEDIILKADGTVVLVKKETLVDKARRLAEESGTLDAFEDGLQKRHLHMVCRYKKCNYFYTEDEAWAFMRACPKWELVRIIVISGDWQEVYDRPIYRYPLLTL
jgi:hypothetical protein